VTEEAQQPRTEGAADGVAGAAPDRVTEAGGSETVQSGEETANAGGETVQPGGETANAGGSETAGTGGAAPAPDPYDGLVAGPPVAGGAVSAYPMQTLPAPPGWPAGGPVPGGGYRPPAPPRDAWRGPTRVEPVPGTEFALGYLTVPAATSGMAVGSLVAGIASLLVSLLVCLFGLGGAEAGWGGWVAGAFAFLAAVLGAGGASLGAVALRQIRRGTAATDRRTGRGLAVAGLSCGIAGLALTVLVFALVLVIQLG
jgi:hypothetical protein